MSLRILRDKAKVRELDISKETLAAAQEIQRTILHNPERFLKELLGHSLCVICRTGIPSIEVRYDLGEATKIEHYCDACKGSLYEKESSDLSEIAAKYNCTIVEELPKNSNYNGGNEVIS